MKPILFAALAVSIACSEARAGKVFSGLFRTEQRSFSDAAYESRTWARFVINGTPEIRMPHNVFAFYEANLLVGPVVTDIGFRSVPLDFGYPTIVLSQSVPTLRHRLPSGTEVFMIIGRQPYRSLVGEPPDEWRIRIELTNGDEERIESAVVPLVWDEPMTAGVPVLLDSIDPGRMLELPNIDGPWHNADVTLFDGTFAGEPITIVLDRFGFDDRTRPAIGGGVQHVVFGVPEPRTWVLAMVAVFAGALLKTGLRYWRV